jgi:hypothetical protein
MSLRRCESPGVIAQIAALSVDHAPTAIIGCPYTSRHDNAISLLAGGAQAAADPMRVESPHRPVGDKTRSSPVSQVGPDPLEKHGRPVPRSDQKQDMRRAPKPPGDCLTNLEAVEVSDGGLPPDRRETARMMGPERFRRRPTLDTPADDTRDINAALLGGGRQPWNQLPVPGEARGDVANHKDDAARVDGEIRPYCNAAGLVWLRAEPRGGRRGLYTRSPQYCPCRQNFACEQHVVVVVPLRT